MQARGAGCKDERQRLVGGVCGRSSGGKRSVLGKEVGCRREREVLQQRPLLMGRGTREEKIKRFKKRQRQVGGGVE